MKQQINTRNIVLILMVLFAAAMRLVSYKFPYVLSNFTPVGAMALFGGVYFTDKWKAFLVPMAALFLSDIILNHLYTSKWVLGYDGMQWTYLCFALMVLIGTFIKQVNVFSLMLASVVSVVLHWLIMDLPWLYGNLYSHDLAGYGKSLTLAVPFELNMLLGDVIYGAILFGGFEAAKMKYTALQVQPKFVTA